MKKKEHKRGEEILVTCKMSCLQECSGDRKEDSAEDFYRNGGGEPLQHVIGIVCDYLRELGNAYAASLADRLGKWEEDDYDVEFYNN